MDFLSTSSELADQMPVTYIIKFQVVPERRDEFLGLLGGVLDAMRDEPPFHEAFPRVLQQTRDITIWEPIRADRRGVQSLVERR
jgi:hypothetical protein